MEVGGLRVQGLGCTRRVYRVYGVYGDCGVYGVYGLGFEVLRGILKYMGS